MACEEDLTPNCSQGGLLSRNLGTDEMPLMQGSPTVPINGTVPHQFLITGNIAGLRLPFQ